jgi:hypothetical protein
MHLMKERKGDKATSKCGRGVAPSDTTVWWTDVTCPECLVLITPAPRVRLIPRG